MNFPDDYFEGNGSVRLRYDMTAISVIYLVSTFGISYHSEKYYKYLMRNFASCITITAFKLFNKNVVWHCPSYLLDLQNITFLVERIENNVILFKVYTEFT